MNVSKYMVDKSMPEKIADSIGWKVANVLAALAVIGIGANYRQTSVHAQNIRDLSDKIIMMSGIMQGMDGRYASKLDISELRQDLTKLSITVSHLPPQPWREAVLDNKAKIKRNEESIESIQNRGRQPR